MDKAAKECIDHINQLIAFWQGKLDHDDCDLISPTMRLLIQHTIQYLKELDEDTIGRTTKR
jgi:hypothetical protein